MRCIRIALSEIVENVEQERRFSPCIGSASMSPALSSSISIFIVNACIDLPELIMDQRLLLNCRGAINGAIVGLLLLRPRCGPAIEGAIDGAIVGLLLLLICSGAIEGRGAEFQEGFASFESCEFFGVSQLLPFEGFTPCAFPFDALYGSLSGSGCNRVLGASNVSLRWKQI